MRMIFSDAGLPRELTKLSTRQQYCPNQSSLIIETLVQYRSADFIDFIAKVTVTESCACACSTELLLYHLQKIQGSLQRSITVEFDHRRSSKCEWDCFDNTVFDIASPTRFDSIVHLPICSNKIVHYDYLQMDMPELISYSNLIVISSCNAQENDSGSYTTSCLSLCLKLFTEQSDISLHADRSENFRDYELNHIIVENCVLRLPNGSV